uniref:Pre-rRNA-processing protein TSR1 homolog n=1 Tax=Setaria digitata TaxID=48799 RepID=A0A915Q0X5_9BILA
MGAGHRSGPLKQSNKKHKSGRHRSKGALDSVAGGKIGSRAVTGNHRFLISKKNRRLQAQQIRKNKRAALLSENNNFSTGYFQQPPLFITVLSFDEYFTADELVALLCLCDKTSYRSAGYNGCLNYLCIKRLKSRYVFATPDCSNTDVILSYLKVSDVIAFIWPSTGEITAKNDILMSTILAHGLPVTIHFVPGLGTTATGTAKQKEIIIKNVTKMIKNWSFENERLMHCDSENDGLLALRLISTMKKKLTYMQKIRPHLIAENIEKIETEGDLCTLKVSGYLKGSFLNVNSLVHVPLLGDFQMKQIVVEDDPHPLTEQVRNVSKASAITLKPDGNLQISLQSELIPDPMDAEQTWPTEEEIFKNALKTKKIMKKVPVGTSTYQAEWIIDDEVEISDEEAEKETKSSNVVKEAAADEESEVENEMEMEKMSVVSDNEDSIDMKDEEVDVAEVEKYREARENEQFPDEIDTPMDVPARIRFQRYRALKSFRTSPWDPLENLPKTYSRIFKFSDYRHSRKTALSKATNESEYSAPRGAFISVYISEVPTRLIDIWPHNKPLIIYGLLAHEQKMSLLNMVLKRHPSCTVPISNKQRLLFHVGYRCFEAEPVFSQHTGGDKFKMERFMPKDSTFVASVFAPIMFPPVPVLVYRLDSHGNQQLVATGGVLNVNPDRIILKRIILSGHPFKINRRSVVVRYMFFNREDIEWFKPVELRTPRGRRGHIKEALGTHGHMKCIFDQQLNAMDTVMMNLYKRVYPKWTYNPVIMQPSFKLTDESEKMEV